MPSENVTVAIVVGIIVGVAAAHIGTKVIREIDEELHKEDLEKAKETAFNEGWAAANDTNAIRNMSVDELFNEEFVEDGITTKVT